MEWFWHEKKTIDRGEEVDDPLDKVLVVSEFPSPVTIEKKSYD